MNDLIRFRCNRCNSSLKIAGAKPGNRVACPKCGLELIIPELTTPENASRPPGSDPPRVELTPSNNPEAGAGVATAVVALDTAPAPSPAAGLGFLNLDLRLDDPAPIDRNARAADAKPAAPPAVTPAPTPAQPTAAAAAAPTVARTVAVAPPSGEVASIRSERTSLRTRDVVIPRAAVTAYTTFAILALFLAFLAGVMIGHFLWSAPPAG